MADKSTRQKRYSAEFKLQAAKLIVEGGTTYHQGNSGTPYNGTKLSMIDRFGVAARPSFDGKSQ